MTTLPILYSFRRCPYAMRARMAIAISGVTVELREVVLRAKPVELMVASAKATVPVLVLVDGTVIDESLDIMRGALDQNDPEGWLTADEAYLIQQNDGSFKAALDCYKYPHRYGLDNGLEYRASGMKWLALLDKRLSSAQYICGPNRGLTDIAIFPFVRQFAVTDREWFDRQPLPKLRYWLDALSQPDLFANVMHRYSQWRAGDARTVFP